jgi:hypothetical protein
MKRISSIPGVTILPFKQAPKYTPGGMREVRAAAWHFAQGGGTDTWLTRLDGAQGNNSCHIVIKYDGSIRQIVEFDDASWSLHISWDADSNDAPDYNIFALRYVKEALGAGWSDPNRYIVAIEIEGFFQTGANAAQRRTIVALARFLEANYPKLVHLGHRDFQDYKPCPGPTLFQGLLPHAGRLDNSAPVNEGEDTMALDFYPVSGGDGIVKITEGRGLVDLNGETITIEDYEKLGQCRIRMNKPYRDGDGWDAGFLVRHEGHAYIAFDAVVADFTPAAPIDPNPALVEEISSLKAELAEAEADLNAIATIVNA